MARPGGEQTRAQITEAVARVVGRDGIVGLTLDAVAAEVGVTKQAVLYHFGSRANLLGEAYLARLGEESSALAEASEGAADADDATRRFLEAALDYHLADPTRFRMIYAAVQMGQAPTRFDEATMREKVYPVTGRIYGSLAQKLASDPDRNPEVDPRQLAIALHMFTIGVACYQGMLAACDETFAHDWHAIANTLADALATAPEPRIEPDPAPARTR